MSPTKRPSTSRTWRSTWKRFLSRFEQRRSRTRRQPNRWPQVKRWLERHRPKPRPAGRKAPEGQALKRLLRRLPRIQRPSWSLQFLLGGEDSGPISTPRAVALALRAADVALLQLTAITLLLNAFPLSLSGPQWYLQVLNGIAESAPVLLLALVLGFVSLSIGPADAAATLFHQKLLRLSRLFSVVVLLLLPLQLGFTVWLFGQAYSNDRAQLAIIRSQADALIAGARQPNSKQEFLRYLQSRNLTANLEAVEAAPLVAVRSEFIQTVEANQKRQEQGLAAATRSTLLRYSLSSLKLFASLAVFAIVLGLLHRLVRRSFNQRMAAAEAAAESPAHSG